jgi:hypothetical protein
MFKHSTFTWEKTLFLSVHPSMPTTVGFGKWEIRNSTLSKRKHLYDILRGRGGGGIWAKIRYYKDVTLCENYVRDFFIAAILPVSVKFNAINL